MNQDEKGKAWLKKESAGYPDKKIGEWIASPGIYNLPSLLNDKEKANASIISYLEKQ